jgi:hypothetical protein
LNPHAGRKGREFIKSPAEILTQICEGDLYVTSHIYFAFMMEVVRIPVSRRKSLTPESERANEEQNRRLRVLGNLVGRMTSALDHIAGQQQATVTRPWMRDFADRLILQHQKPPLDRLAKRHKRALIAWFAANCPEFLSTPTDTTATVPVPEPPDLGTGFDDDPPPLDLNEAGCDDHDCDFYDWFC